jgi:hypothetical protein
LLRDTVIVVRKRGSSSTGDRHRWYWTTGLVAVALTVVVAAGAVWMASTVHREWDRLDSAAEEFKAPRGFTQVDRVRQGTALCWVSCTNGGEAAVTLVLETDATDPEQACRVLRTALVDLVGDAVWQLDDDTDGTCGWAGDLGGSATVAAVAGPRSAFDAASGYRWREKVEAPDSPVVAFVEFNSGIE